MSPAAWPLTRRVVALCCLAWIAGLAAAQDPNAIAAQVAARDWLALTDRGDAPASWNAAGKKFKNALPPATWAEALERERAPLGPMLSRAISKTGFEKTFPSAPDGDYALVAYATSFANRPVGRETVTLEREVDGTWRVIGYDVH